MAGKATKTPEHRFGEKLWALPNGCIVWTAGLNLKGYARFYVDGGTMQAHRWAYGEEHIPEGLQLDHLCRNRACQNPDHLEPVTSGENILRGEGCSAVNARKTHCPEGHPLSGNNLNVVSSGKRRCRICDDVRREARKTEDVRLGRCTQCHSRPAEDGKKCCTRCLGARAEIRAAYTAGVPAQKPVGYRVVCADGGVRFQPSLDRGQAERWANGVLHRMVCKGPHRVEPLGVLPAGLPAAPRSTPGGEGACTTCKGKGVVADLKLDPAKSPDHIGSCPDCDTAGSGVHSDCETCGGSGEVRCRSLDPEIDAMPCPHPCPDCSTKAPPQPPHGSTGPAGLPSGGAV